MSLARCMQSPEPSKRSYLGMLLRRKCRAGNKHGCDGSAPEECLYCMAARCVHRVCMFISCANTLHSASRVY